MGAFDFLCCACGSGGYNAEHMNQWCSATILVKQWLHGAAGPASWFSVGIEGVYNGHGVIETNVYGKKPFNYDGGWHYSPPYPQYDSSAPQAVTESLRQQWKEQCIPTVRFYCTQFIAHFPSWKVRPAEFVAFDIKCSACMISGSIPLPPLGRMETLADFHTRMGKTAAHQTLVKARAQLDEHAGLAKTAQEILEKAQAAVHLARLDVDCCKQTLAKTQAEVAEAQAVLDGCDEHVCIVHEKEPPKKRQRRADARADW